MLTHTSDIDHREAGDRLTALDTETGHDRDQSRTSPSDDTSNRPASTGDGGSAPWTGPIASANPNLRYNVDELAERYADPDQCVSQLSDLTGEYDETATAVEEYLSGNRESLESLGDDLRERSSPIRGSIDVANGGHGEDGSAVEAAAQEFRTPRI
ncbi:hypothetical protein [Halopiger aswanensis]|uniref:Uncharacterized protein n=1 Tax=Halopiger aswanensis TaxID=148449 RepID=A0A419VVQ0_9EURY|nr:hypothetical protein [Halopiger aswanensis]RKD86244.1 hypothetical protein ATJ93_4661 [Halopiger aswanensis]